MYYCSVGIKITPESKIALHMHRSPEITSFRVC